MSQNYFTTSLLGLMVALGAGASDDELSYLYKIDYDHEVTSILEISNDNKPSLYNTGFRLSARDPYGFGANFRGGINQEIVEIDSDDFELNTFIKELNFSYEYEAESATVLLSVGKMKEGVKTDTSSAKDLGGVMGIRLNIAPKKIPLIQNWLTKNNLKITSIAITRYSSESDDRVAIGDLSEADMTSYAVNLSHKRNLHAFFVHRRPDDSNVMSAISTSVGGIYNIDADFNPQIFVLNHSTTSDYVDLDLNVIAVSAEVAPDIRAGVNYAKVNEHLYDIEKKSWNFSVSKKFKKVKGWTFKATTGLKLERGDESENIYYFRLEAKF